MKLLCVSDQIDPLVYTNAIRESFDGIDLILSAGDLPKDYLDFISGALEKPLLFVSGSNHIHDGKTCAHLDGKVRREQNLLVAGLGGSKKHEGRKNAFTDFQMYVRMLKLLPALFLNRIIYGRFLDILLTHASPFGIHDRRDISYRGFKSFLWFTRLFKPRYLVHGHIHLYQADQERATRYFSTLVINAYGHFIIDTSDNTRQ